MSLDNSSHPICVFATCPNHNSNLSMHLHTITLPCIVIALAIPTSITLVVTLFHFLWILIIHCSCHLCRQFATANSTSNCSGNPLIFWPAKSWLSIALATLTFHPGNHHKQMCWHPVTLWFVQHRLSIALAKVLFCCFSNTNNQMCWQSHHSMVCLTLSIHCSSNNNFPLLWQYKQSTALTIPSFYSFLNPQPCLPIDLATPTLYCCGNINNQLHWHSHHSMALWTLHILRFYNTNVLLLWQ